MRAQIRDRVIPQADPEAIACQLANQRQVSRTLATWFGALRGGATYLPIGLGRLKTTCVVAGRPSLARSLGQCDSSFETLITEHQKGLSPTGADASHLTKSWHVPPL